jgi:glycerol-3-phosphate dehydrogenase
MSAPSPTDAYDLLVIGGGINGTGIARDAAGRGLKVLLCEKDDLARHTSSASTKLIHGGLRYLEHYEFGLVRKSLAEREVLMRAAPHLVSPLRFVMPHDAAQRPAWFLRAGLFLYDHLAPRRLLPPSRQIRLAGTPLAAPLQARFALAFEYSDGWVDDARLVVMNAVDAALRGAVILTRTRCAKAAAEGAGWRVTLAGPSGPPREVRAAALVNAAGPFAGRVVHEVLGERTERGLRLIKGSHLVVPRLFEHDHAYLFQNPDRRVIFAIPYHGEFTLIGTTDVEFHGDLDRIEADAGEIDYLCAMASRYFKKAVRPADVVHSYAGVRPLLDEAGADPADVTRDYRLELVTEPAPVLHVWGGKLTTYRRLAEEALHRLRTLWPEASGAWTATSPLPGGDLAGPGRLAVGDEFEGFSARLLGRYPFLPAETARRYAKAYGTRAEHFLSRARCLEDLGRPLLLDLYEAEARYLVEAEWARSTDDILWRRTKLGLWATAEDKSRLAQWLSSRTGRS